MSRTENIAVPAGCGAKVLDAEHRLLASCLHGGDVFDNVAELIDESDFTATHHAAVWRAMGFVRGACEAFDLGSICGRIKEAEAAYAAELLPTVQEWLWHAYDALEPVGANWRHYAGRVRDASLLRQLRHAAEEIRRNAEQPFGPADEMIATAERKLFELGRHDRGRGPVVARDLVRQALARIDSRIADGGKVNGLETGYPDLDAYLAGMKPGQLLVLAARPGGGKTSLALNIAVNVARDYGTVLFFSLEMSRNEIADRLLALGSGVSVSRINKGLLQGEHVAGLAAQSGPDGIGELPIWVEDSSLISADRMISTARRAVRRRGCKFVAVDYLQLVNPENPRDNRTQQVGLLARRMKQLARECGVPVLLLSQLNREIEGRAKGEPMLADLRESGEIEQHADAVVMLWPESDQAEDADVWTIRVKVAKNRAGPTGKLALAYRRPVMRFENAARGVPT